MMYQGIYLEKMVFIVQPLLLQTKMLSIANMVVPWGFSNMTKSDLAVASLSSTFSNLTLDLP